jgi:phage terminase large subunit GpA-like protein
VTPLAPDLDVIDREIDRYWLPPPRVPMADWADEHFWLPSGDSNAGRWRTFPYQRDILNAISDPDVERVSVKKSTQVGWSNIVKIAISYHVDTDPCRILIVQPTIDDGEKYSKEDVIPMFEELPCLQGKVTELKSRDSRSTILMRLFDGGSLSIVGANSARGFRRVTRRFIGLEECDEYPRSSGAQGDPCTLAIRRSDAFWNRKIVAGSTPRIEGFSRIEDFFLAGDQRRRYLPCPRCGVYHPLEFENLKWPTDHPEQAVFLCPTNACTIEHRSLRDMDAAGEWRAEKPEHFTETNRHRSFSIWAAYSYLPNVTWGQIASEYVKGVRGGPETHQAVVNTVLGRTWTESATEPLDWEKLYLRRARYRIGTCPAGVLLVVCGVDVQKDALKYEVLGLGRGKRSWSIDMGALPGDTADLAKGPWVKLSAILDREWPHEYGVMLTIALMAVDSGFNTLTVYSWARQYPMTRVIAIKGQPSGHTLISPPRPFEVSRAGKRIKRGYKQWDVGSHAAKSELYGWLNLKSPTAEDTETPPGYCNFPEYGETYFRELTNMKAKTVRDHRGYSRLEMVKAQVHLPDDFLLARCYARAAAAVVGLDRFQESDWLALEAAVGKPADVEPEVYDDEVPDDETTEVTA